MNTKQKMPAIDSEKASLTQVVLFLQAMGVNTNGMTSKMARETLSKKLMKVYQKPAPARTRPAPRARSRLRKRR